MSSSTLNTLSDIQKMAPESVPPMGFSNIFEHEEVKQWKLFLTSATLERLTPVLQACCQLRSGPSWVLTWKAASHNCGQRTRQCLTSLSGSDQHFLDTLHLARSTVCWWSCWLFERVQGTACLPSTSLLSVFSDMAVNQKLSYCLRWSSYDATQVVVAHVSMFLLWARGGGR